MSSINDAGFCVETVKPIKKQTTSGTDQKTSTSSDNSTYFQQQSSNTTFSRTATPKKTIVRINNTSTEDASKKRLEKSKMWKEFGESLSKSACSMAKDFTELGLKLHELKKSNANSTLSNTDSAPKISTEKDIPEGKSVADLNQEKANLQNETNDLLAVKNKLADYDDFKTNTYEPLKAEIEALGEQQGDLMSQIKSQQNNVNSLLSDDEINDEINSLKAQGKDESSPEIANLRKMLGSKAEQEAYLQTLKDKEAEIATELRNKKEELKNLDAQNAQYLEDLAGANEQDLMKKIAANQSRIKEIDEKDLPEAQKAEEAAEIDETEKNKEAEKTDGENSSETGAATSSQDYVNNVLSNLEGLSNAEKFEAIRDTISSLKAEGASGDDERIKLLESKQDELKNVPDDEGYVISELNGKTVKTKINADGTLESVVSIKDDNGNEQTITSVTDANGNTKVLRKEMTSEDGTRILLDSDNNVITEEATDVGRITHKTNDDGSNVVRKDREGGYEKVTTDKDGNVTKTQTVADLTDENGKVVGKAIITENSDGTANKKIIDNSGNVLESIDYQLNENGQLISADGYELDEKGNALLINENAEETPQTPTADARTETPQTPASQTTVEDKTLVDDIKERVIENKAEENRTAVRQRGEKYDRMAEIKKDYAENGNPQYLEDETAFNGKLNECNEKIKELKQEKADLLSKPGEGKLADSTREMTAAKTTYGKAMGEYYAVQQDITSLRNKLAKCGDDTSMRAQIEGQITMKQEAAVDIKRKLDSAKFNYQNKLDDYNKNVDRYNKIDNEIDNAKKERKNEINSFLNKYGVSLDAYGSFDAALKAAENNSKDPALFNDEYKALLKETDKLSDKIVRNQNTMRKFAQ